MVISSFPDSMADWSLLVSAVENNSETLPDLSGLLGPLKGFLSEARELDAVKAAARSQLSQGAKRTRALVPEGREAASRLRNAIKVHFGSHNEKLLEFGIAPLRTPRRRQPANPPKPDPEISVPQPE